MSFPQTPLDMRVELYTLGDWVNVTSDVLQEDKVTISRGRQNETTKITTPGTCRFNLRNNARAAHGARTYDPRWPTSPYYGTLGKGTPLRVGLRTEFDAFGRTASSAWGTSDGGHVWAVAGGSASDYNVGSGKATHLISTTNTFRVSSLVGFSQRDVDVKVTYSLGGVASVTGAALEPANIMIRRTDANNYNFLRVSIAAGGAITLAFITKVAGVDTTVQAATATGLTHSAATAVTVRVVTEGTVTRAKIWAAGTPEPFDWLWYVRTNDNYGAGTVGIRSGVATSNTNVPVTFSYDDFEVMSPRFFGAVSAFPQKQDQSGQHRWVEVEAADIFRQIQTGESPLQSTLRRGIPGLPDLVGYWPMEDGSDAISAEAATSGTQPMEVSQGVITWASDSTFEGSEPIPVPKLGTMHAIVPAHTVGYEMVRFLLHVPSSGLTDGQALCTVHTQGTIGRWRLTWRTAGGLTLTWYAAGTVAYIGDSGAVGFNINDRPVMLSIEMWQVGSAINWAFVTVDPGATVGGAASGSIASQTLGPVTDVYLTPDMDVQNVSYGHLHVQRAFHSLFDLGPQLNAWRNELARNRVARLTTENGFTASSYRSTQTPDEPSTKMGPQGIKTLADLLEDTAQADLAILMPMKSSSHLQHRTHPSMQGQDPRAVIDVAAHELAAPPLPTDDDQDLVNDFTAKRLSGSSYEAQQTTGRLSTASPSAGGIGVYDSEGTFNVANDNYLPDVAGWKIALGAYDGPRYPQLQLARHQPEVVANSTLSAALLDVDQGDVLQLQHLTPSSDRAMVFGYKEVLGGFEHSFTFNSGPGDPWNIAVTDDTDVRLDSDSSTLTSSLTTTATSVSVTIASGAPPWIDSTGFASEFPFDIDVGGEQMTVTAITGTSSPQTFTVTRSVNGVVKAHSAGESVHLADPVFVGAGIQT